jgi:hypothetical protein
LWTQIDKTLSDDALSLLATWMEVMTRPAAGLPAELARAHLRTLRPRDIRSYTQTSVQIMRLERHRRWTPASSRSRTDRPAGHDSLPAP